MKANNLAISVPNYGCSKNCPYCISKMTGYKDKNLGMFYRNMGKVVKMAEIAQVNNVIITGKGEPLFDEDSINQVIQVAKFFREYPLEIQTNGKRLLNYPELMDRLYLEGINTIAVSVDNEKQMNDIVDLFPEIHRLGMLVRLTFNITDMFEGITFETMLCYCTEHNIDQLSIRKITTPSIVKDTPDSWKAFNWIAKHGAQELYDDINIELKQAILSNSTKLSTLSFGATIFDIEGIAVTIFDHCIQESNMEDDIRSLIYEEDGHLYYTWDSPASKIF